MGISRSAHYEQAVPTQDDTAIVEAIAAICEEFENYGLRRDNQDGNRATIRMRMRRCRGDEGRA